MRSSNRASIHTRMPKRGQPLYKGQYSWIHSCPQHVLYSEVKLYYASLHDDLYLTECLMCRVAYTGAGYKAQSYPANGRVVVELCHIVKVALEGLEVEGLVDLVLLGDEGGATVEDKEEKVNCLSRRRF